MKSTKKLCGNKVEFWWYNRQRFE